MGEQLEKVVTMDATKVMNSTAQNVYSTFLSNGSLIMRCAKRSRTAILAVHKLSATLDLALRAGRLAHTCRRVTSGYTKQA